MSKALAAGAAAVLVASCLTGCGGQPVAVHCQKPFKVVLVSDAGGLSDGGRNADSWSGLQAAAADRDACLSASAIGSAQASDYGPNLEAAARTAGLVIASGPALAAAAVTAARASPGTTFAVAGYTSDGTLPNLVGLTFKADQAAYLAGMAAGLFTHSNAVGAVYPVESADSEAIRAAFEAGAVRASPKIKIFGVYQPPGAGFDDTAYGQARAQEELGQGADVIFNGGRSPGVGVLTAAAGKPGAACIGWETDQYLSVASARPCLLTSALFSYSTAAATAARRAAAGKLKGPNLVFGVAGAGVGIAPFHDLAARVTPEMRRRLDETRKALASGRQPT